MSDRIARSHFDLYGGHYAVLINGVEFARFAPSEFWSRYAIDHDLQPGTDYVWVPKS